MFITCRALIGRSRKLATYITQAAFEGGLSTSWWMQAVRPELDIIYLHQKRVRL